MIEIDYNKISEQIIDEIIQISFNKFAQKIEVGAEDIINAIITELQEKSIKIILTANAAYKSLSKNEGFLFPDGTRFLFEQDDVTVAVIEQKPQLRTLLLEQDLWNATDNMSIHFKRFQLAFPYVIFICCAIEGELPSLKVYFRNKPLNSLYDILYQTVFPNVDVGTGFVCQSEPKLGLENSFSQFCENAIANFWQSAFNSDSKSLWTGRTKIDKNLELETWVALSKVNPMFPCSIKWFQETSLVNAMDHSIETIMDQGNSNKISINISENLIEQMGDIAKDLERKLKTYLSTNRLEKFYPKKIGNDLADALQETHFEMESTIRKLIFALKSTHKKVDRQKIQWENSPNGGMWD